MIRLCIALPFLALGLFAFLSAVVGFYRFPYVMSRMHAAAVGDTLGIGSIVIAVAILTGSAAATLRRLTIRWFLRMRDPSLAFYSSSFRNTYLLPGMTSHGRWPLHISMRVVSQASAISTLSSRRCFSVTSIRSPRNISIMSPKVLP